MSCFSHQGVQVLVYFGMNSTAVASSASRCCPECRLECTRESAFRAAACPCQGPLRRDWRNRDEWLARILHAWGYLVSGSDAFPSDLTAQLVSEGIGVQAGHEDVACALAADLVVATAALRETNPEL